MDTAEFIKRLAADLQPVRPLRPPWARALLWLGLALLYVAAIVWRKSMINEASQVAGNARFLAEQAATLATAMTAAIAAFCSIIPGFDRRVLLLPVVPLGLWLASVGLGCVQDWLQRGADGLTLRADWDCLPSAIVMGIVPSVMLVIMLRKGAPLLPRVSLALGALAVASVANLGLQLAHARDASIMVLVWHLGAVAVWVAIGGWLGAFVLGRRHASSVR
ncbi:MAG: DUF1109 domain-containing protein [Hyphomonadaceae bacterium]|jgi:hypothetical protein|nr:DUF1109 domain-containing protein [Hyphomonadaceae bacterium]